MKLPVDAEIPREKLTGYLLLPRQKADKSRWLARGGYSRAHPERLESDLRSQILVCDAEPARPSSFGETYEIIGRLVGPSGVPLPVRTIWIKDVLSSRVRFVTLIPLPRK